MANNPIKKKINDLLDEVWKEYNSKMIMLGVLGGLAKHPDKHPVSKLIKKIRCQLDNLDEGPEEEDHYCGHLNHVHFCRCDEDQKILCLKDPIFKMEEDEGCSDDDHKEWISKTKYRPYLGE